MIVRKRLYQCEMCWRRCEFRWQEDYPETIKCPCGAKARILGFGEGKTARMIMRQKVGQAHETEYWLNARMGEER